MFGTLKTLALVGAVAASALMTSAAHADGRIIGLVDGKTIVTIDPASKKVMSTVNVSGAGPLLGIDVRPADGMLYGVTSDGSIVTIDVASGKATMKSKLSEPWTRSAAVTFDFNPVADRLRLMSAEGVSWRINVDDGKVTVDGSHKYKDAMAGTTPRVAPAPTPTRSRTPR
jgi:DNA-binding beta-propeller fold protein YncE